MIINAILLKFILSPAYCFHKKNKKKLFLSEFIRVEHFSLKKKKKNRSITVNRICIRNESPKKTDI